MVYSLPLLQVLTCAESRGVNTAMLRDDVKANGGTLRAAIIECLRDRLTAEEWIVNRPLPTSEMGSQAQTGAGER